MYPAKQMRDGLPDAVPIAPHALAGHPDWLLGSMIGRSAAMHRLFRRCAAPPGICALGRSRAKATGKTIAARTLHDLGPAAAGPFVPCQATHFFQPGPSLASLTPLAADAREGTLLLSHVEELSLDQQARLITFLRWIDHQQSRHTPDAALRQVFFSSRAPLRKLAASPQFRADLCHRLTAIRFIMPPLRERCHDLGLLADSFARHFSSTHTKLVRGIGPQTLERLAAHNWPGNVRELQSVIHTAALDCQGQWIRPIDLPALSPAPETKRHRWKSGRDDANLDRAILRHIQRVLARMDGNKLRAAKMLGVSRSTLYRLLDGGSVSRAAVQAGSLNSHT